MQGHQRLIDPGMVARHLADQNALREGVTPEQARDAIRVLASVAYETWIGRAMADAVL